MVCSTLVRLQFEGDGQQADAAFAALAALGTYNRGNKLAALHELVRRLIDGDAKARTLCSQSPSWQRNQHLFTPGCSYLGLCAVSLYSSEDMGNSFRSPLLLPLPCPETGGFTYV